MKKKYIYIGIFILIISLLICILVFCNKNYEINSIDNKVQEIVTEDYINKKTEEVLSFDNGNIAYLTINSIGLSDAPIKDGTELSVLAETIGHFKETPYFSGNICLAAHNRGYNKNFFQNLKDIEMGDEIIYKTKYSEQKYIVSEINEIEETDLSVLNSTGNNQLTLITCIENKSTKRLCVIATGKN